MEQKTTKKAKKPVKSKKKAIEPHFADLINFKEFFRAKGERGLWIMRSNVNRTGFINMSRFMMFNKSKTFKIEDLTSLGSLVFQTELGKKDLGFRDVFKNIFDNEEKFFKLKSVDKMMKMAVPFFDEDCFKDYHLQRVCEWYKEIIKGVGDEIRNKKKDIKKTVID